MLNLPLVIAPDPIFRKKAAAVEAFDASLKKTISHMFETLYEKKGLGLAANMVGLPKQIIVIDLQEDGMRQPLVLINPRIREASVERQTFMEASLSYPGIEAEISRPQNVTVSYLDESGSTQEISAGGLLSTVIQHEMDYLNGRTFLDHLSRLKRDRLLRKYKKQRNARLIEI
jgi:peptide deformylase